MLLLLHGLLRLRDGWRRPCWCRRHLVLVPLRHLGHLALQLLLVVLLQQRELLLLLLRELLLQGVLGCLLLLLRGLLLLLRLQLRGSGCTHGDASAVTEGNELVVGDQVPCLRLLGRGCGCILCGCCCCSCCCRGRGCCRCS